ncbi:hypothetical protein F3561_21675 [Salmonella enterica subsp. enterica]|nr:hypothetical protein [Salmonella enterica subsp. enterica serovar Chester]
MTKRHNEQETTSRLNDLTGQCQAACIRVIVEGVKQARLATVVRENPCIVHSLNNERDERA